MEDQGLGYLLNNLLARQLGASLHEDPFSGSMNPMGMVNAPQAQIYGPVVPPEQQQIDPRLLSGGFEEEPKKNENSIQLGNLGINPRANYSTSDMSRGISGLRDMLYNSGYGGNFNYKFGDSGFSLLGNYGKSRSSEDFQYRDYPSNSNVNSSTNRDFTLRYGKEFEPGGGLSSLFR
jgi:hypothetical protein